MTKKLTPEVILPLLGANRVNIRVTAGALTPHNTTQHNTTPHNTIQYK